MDYRPMRPHDISTRKIIEKNITYNDNFYGYRKILDHKSHFAGFLAFAL